jgi:hypothetical protein
MKWRSEETLAAYQHYSNEKLDADTRDSFHQRMHEQVQQHLEERRQGKRGQQVSRKEKETSPSAQPLLQVNDEPDLAFLYSLAGEV